MSAGMVLSIVSVSLAVLFAWAFRALPRERWQVLAVLPSRKEPDGRWRGVNLTYYGLFNGLGVLAGVATVVFLLGSVGVSLALLAFCLLAVFAVTVPSAKIINRLVEGHWHGFTVGGAAFMGMVAGPWIIWSVAYVALPAEEVKATVLHVVGALASAYALGEGIGRLACISFGCCYGRTLEACPAWLSRRLGRAAFVFEGSLKKSSYEHGYEGVRLVPIQAMTCIVSSAAGVAGIGAFLYGHPLAAYWIAVVVTQAWRFTSEFLRADYRGKGRISAYQNMALAGAVYSVLLGFCWVGLSTAVPDVMRGLSLLWTPGAIVLLQALTLTVTLFMGLSTVTTARVDFGLACDRHA